MTTDLFQFRSTVNLPAKMGTPRVSYVQVQFRNNLLNAWQVIETRTLTPSMNNVVLFEIATELPISNDGLYTFRVVAHQPVWGNRVWWTKTFENLNGKGPLVAHLPLGCPPSSTMSEVYGDCVIKPYDGYKSCVDERARGYCKTNMWVQTHCRTTCKDQLPPLVNVSPTPDPKHMHQRIPYCKPYEQIVNYKCIPKDHCKCENKACRYKLDTIRNHGSIVEYALNGKRTFGRRWEPQKTNDAACLQELVAWQKHNRSFKASVHYINGVFFYEDIAERDKRFVMEN